MSCKGICRIVVHLCLFLAVAGVALAETRRISARLTTHGETILEHVTPPASLQQSLIEMSYAEAFSKVLTDPITPLFIALFRTSNTEGVQAEAINNFLANPPAKYLRYVQAAGPFQYRIINPQTGTLENPQLWPFTFADVKLSLAWWRVTEDAHGAFERLAPIDRDILQKWLAGAKAAYSDPRWVDIFMREHPTLEALGLRQHFLSMNVVHVVEQMISLARLYDNGAANGFLAALWAGGWFGSSGTAALSGASPTMRTFGPLTNGPEFPTSNSIYALAPVPMIQNGASNAWAIRYIPQNAPATRLNAMAYEGHQPNTPAEQVKVTLQKMFRGLTRFSASIAGLPGTALSATSIAAVGATAGPSSASNMFAIPCNSDCSALLDQGNSIPFTNRVVIAAGRSVTAKRAVLNGIDFGEVLYLVRDPISGARFAVTMRLKEIRKFPRGVLTLHRSFVDGNDGTFAQALNDGAANWGMAGFYKDELFAALTQGNPDRVVNEAGLNRLALNAPLPQYAKVGEYNGPHCRGLQNVAAANNGPLRGAGLGCGLEQYSTEEKNALDPAFPEFVPFRQAMVEEIYDREGMATTPKTEAQIYQFLTSTESYSQRRVTEALVVALFNYAQGAIGVAGTPEQIAFAGAVAGAMIGRSPVSDGSIFPVLLLYIDERLKEISAQLNQTTRGFLTGPQVSLAEFVQGLDAASATEIIKVTVEAIEFVLWQCVGQGKISWGQIARVNHFSPGDTAAVYSTSPGAAGIGEALNLAGYQFDKAQGARVCQITAMTSSPLKSAVTQISAKETRSCSLPHSTYVDSNSLVRGWYQAVTSSWVQRWNALNRDGQGSDNPNDRAYRCLTLSESEGDFKVTDREIVFRYEISLPPN